MTDIKRSRKQGRSRWTILFYVVLGVGSALIVTRGLSRLEPAAPELDSSQIWIGTVKRGPLVVDVQGPGTLVPEEIRWIGTEAEGRVEKIFALPGTDVESETPIIQLANPQLERESANSELLWKKAEAELEEMRVEVARERISLLARAASVKAEYEHRRVEAELNAKLAGEGLISKLALHLSQVTAKELRDRNELEAKSLDIFASSVKARLAAKQSEVAQVRGMAELRREQVANLTVRATISGILQEILVETGQWITSGTVLGIVAVPEKLKAELKIVETQAKDVRLGQKVLIDTGATTVPAVIRRIDPAAHDGAVTVDASFSVSQLSPEARPYLNINGTVEIERLQDVLTLQKPVYARSNSKIALFKLESETEAIKTAVTIGRVSVTMVEVIEGLQEGDRVILSDMTAMDSVERVRIN